jgi:peptidoglycan-associated lipoprotein
MLAEFLGVTHNRVGRNKFSSEKNMKPTLLAKLLVLGLIVAVSAVGCRKGPPRVTPITGQGATSPKGPGPEGPAGEGTGIRPPTGEPLAPVDPNKLNPLGKGHDGWKEDKERFRSETVYFEYDKSAVRTKEAAKVQIVGDYLKASPNHAVRVAGHCDERGTEEYNRALGERRALAIREVLIGLGIAPDRVDTVSFGEDQPADPGHDDTAWAKNRRGEFILLTPP